MEVSEFRLCSVGPRESYRLQSSSKASLFISGHHLGDITENAYMTKFAKRPFLKRYYFLSTYYVLVPCQAVYLKFTVFVTRNSSPFETRKLKLTELKNLPSDTDGVRKQSRGEKEFQRSFPDKIYRTW